MAPTCGALVDQGHRTLSCWRDSVIQACNLILPLPFAILAHFMVSLWYFAIIITRFDPRSDQLDVLAEERCPTTPR